MAETFCMAAQLASNTACFARAFAEVRTTAVKSLPLALQRPPSAIVVRWSASLRHRAE